MDGTDTWISIAEAARRAGVARSTLYESYINTGKLRVETVQRGKKNERRVDINQLNKIFDLSGDDTESVRRRSSFIYRIDDLECDIETLKDQIAVLQHNCQLLRADIKSNFAEIRQLIRDRDDQPLLNLLREERARYNQLLLERARTDIETARVVQSLQSQITGFRG